MFRDRRGQVADAPWWPGALLVLVVVAVLVFLQFAAVPAAGATPENTTGTVAPYYNNSSTQVANVSWTEGHREPTLANTTHYLTRIGSFVIGSQMEAPGGAGPASVLLTGLLVIGVTIGSTVRANVGPAGGSVLGLVTAYGLSKAGLMPEWLFAVVLMLLGLVATAAVVRSVR